MLPRRRAARKSKPTIARRGIPMDYATAVGENLRQAPTRAAARAALSILLELASEGDVAAARTLATVLARKLGRHDAVKAIEDLKSLSDVLEQGGIPPLLRLYLLAFIP